MAYSLLPSPYSLRLGEVKQQHLRLVNADNFNLARCLNDRGVAGVEGVARQLDLSEAGGVSSCDHYGHMGGLMPGVALRVVDPEDPEGPALGPGAVGEFQLQTRAMMQGYINEKEEAFTKDGWFKSGDLGW